MCDEEYEKMVQKWIKKQEDKVYRLFEEKQLLSEEHNACALTKEEYEAALRKIDSRGFDINHDLAFQGFDPIYF
jgi:hypothetical protein